MIRPMYALLAFSLCLPIATMGQTDAPFEESEDTHYFDFWPGYWAELSNGRPDTTLTTFHVRRTVHPAAFAEEWKLFYGDAAHHATALRAWDGVHRRWMFTWVSDNGLFQVWEGQVFEGHWFIVREFEIDGRRFLSRQAWIPEGPGLLTRVMERSFDGGETWQPRSRTRFARVR